MAPRTFHRRWEWRFRSPPEVVWPLVADTNRFDFEAGLPRVERRGPPTDAGLPMSQKVMGLGIAWDERPYEWVRPKRFGVVRTYTRGPVAELRVLAELKPDAGGTKLTYQLWTSAASALGRAIIPIKLNASHKLFDRVFRRYDRIAVAGEPSVRIEEPAELAPGGAQRIAAIRGALLRSGANAALVDRLVRTVTHADDLAAARLRPYELAEWWHVPRRDVLELCLRATRAGLLELQWDLMCPLCRGAKATADTLSAIKPQVHCEACRIDFSVNFDRLVELTFRPNASIRPVRDAAYCVGSPQLTPHIVVQQRLAPGEERAVDPVLEPGRYRLRALGDAGALPVSIADDGESGATLTFDGRWPERDATLSPHPQLVLRNDSPSPQQVMLERTAWTDKATSAADVITMQTFRDLFAAEALRTGEQMSVGSLAILFTDLCGSTGLYRRIGDAPAFGRVLTHFDVLRDAIATEQGSMVKTIGDAVMAVFRSPAAAVRAIRAAQGRLNEDAAAHPDGALVLKAGVHYGPCIAVTLNERLDYFGSTVNVAARLGGLSTGGDVVISEAVRNDPEVEDMLRGSIVAEAFEARLRGFDEERFALWRIVG